MTKYILRESNSGGYWWINDDQYQALIDGGWGFVLDEPSPNDIRVTSTLYGKPDSFARKCRLNGVFVETDSIQKAVESFEKLTGLNFFEQGCNCCGVPFSLSSEDHQEYISGADCELQIVRPF